MAARRRDEVDQRPGVGDRIDEHHGDDDAQLVGGDRGDNVDGVACHGPGDGEGQADGDREGLGPGAAHNETVGEYPDEHVARPGEGRVGPGQCL